MGYADEEYLKIKYRKEHPEEFEEEQVEENTEPVQYERMLFLEERISMEVPVDCKEVDREAIELVFYGSNKPQYVIESESTKVAYGYNYTEMEIGNDDIFRFATFSAKVLEQSGPGVKIRKIKNEKIVNEKSKETYNLSKVQFTSKGYDGGIYNTMFYISLEGKLLINFIIVPSAEYNIRKEIIGHMIETYQVEEKKEDGDNNL